MNKRLQQFVKEGKREILENDNIENVCGVSIDYLLCHVIAGLRNYS